MALKSRAMRDLDDIGSGRRQFGRVPTKQMQKQRSIPTNIIFANEDTGEYYSLNTNGICKFLRDSRLPVTQENIDWCADALLNTSVDDAVNLNGANVGVSFELDYDPRGRSLSQLGIAKSSVVRPMNLAPSQSIQVQKGDYIPPQYGGMGGMLPGGIPVGDGRGIDFGKPVMTVYNDRISKYRKDRSQIL